MTVKTAFFCERFSLFHLSKIIRCSTVKKSTRSMSNNKYKRDTWKAYAKFSNKYKDGEDFLSLHRYNELTDILACLANSYIVHFFSNLNFSTLL